MSYIKENPLDRVDKPKSAKGLLPSVNNTDVHTLINNANNTRDKAIISLLSDSGMRLSELAIIKASDIDWDSYIITIIGEGNKQRRASFTDMPTKFLQLYLSDNHHFNGSIWEI